MSKVAYCLFFISFLLQGCKIFQPDPDAIACDSLSNFAHNWYKQEKANGTVGLIGTGILNIYSGENALSTLKVKNHNRELLNKTHVFLGREGLGFNAIEGRNPIDNYVMFLIPPKAAEKYFSQFHYQRTRSPEYLATPLYLVVEKDAFYEGSCREGGKPFVISSIENLHKSAPAQFNIDRQSLMALTSGLYLDPISYDVEALTSRLKIVDQSTWGGWVELDIDRHKRNFFHWLFRRSEGKQVHIQGIQKVDGPTAIPSVSEVVKENLEISKSWIPIVNDYNDSAVFLKQDVEEFLTAIRSGSLSTSAYQQQTANIRNKITDIAELIFQYKQQMEKDRGMFVTDVEMNLYLNAMKDDLSATEDKFNEIAIAYTQISQVQQGGLVKPDLFLSGSPAIILGANIEPTKLKSLAINDPGSGFQAKINTVAYAEAEDDNQFRIKVRGLIGLSEAIRNNANVMRSLVYSHQSCSRKFRMDMGKSDRLEGNSYIKPIPVELEQRSCWSFNVYYPCGLFKVCKKRVSGWTKLFTVGGAGKVGLSVKPKGNGDYGLESFYNACFFGFICSGERNRISSIKNELRKDAGYNDMYQRYAAEITSIALSYASNNEKYAAINVETKPMSGAEAIALLTLINSQE